MGDGGLTNQRLLTPRALVLPCRLRSVAGVHVCAGVRAQDKQMFPCFLAAGMMGFDVEWPRIKFHFYLVPSFILNWKYFSLYNFPMKGPHCSPVNRHFHADPAVILSRGSGAPVPQSNTACY